ncbi:MAG: HAMP domain-containing histidine kinase [Leptolyngbyaceae cyanobacterium SU_3_3]|nr:HAMP domain-containing histidine kinase [Leptolyngbyaceae cyanobacterium SU_3_3]
MAAYNLTSSIANIQTILGSVERSSKIVFALRNYARFDHTGKRQLMRLVDGLETVLEIYHNQLKRNIRVVRNYQNIPNIWGYPDELIQVWTNLIHNAMQAMESGGTLTVAFCQRDNGVEVSITDTGTGISPEVQQKIFDAFFTTKLLGEGSGLGLYISQKIIDKHQGRMKVESQPGQTQFRVWLPIESV